MNWSQLYAGAERERRVSAAPAAAELDRYGQLPSGNLTKKRLNPTSQAADSWHKKFNSRLVAPDLKHERPQAIPGTRTMEDVGRLDRTWRLARGDAAVSGNAENFA